MLTKRATALLISTTMLAGAAIAQTNTPAPPPSTTPTATPMTQSAAPATSGTTGQFITTQNQDQFRASKFVGLSIYGQEGDRIGDINEVLLDATGSAKAVVIGVGGFLGIGEKNVAVPWSAVEWSMTRPTPNTTASTPASSTATSDSRSTMGSTPSTASSAATTGTGAPMGSAGTTGSTMGSGAGSTAATTGNAAANRSPAEQAAMNGYPDHGKVRMTKADLQGAPDFKWYGDTRR